MEALSSRALVDNVGYSGAPAGFRERRKPQTLETAVDGAAVPLIEAVVTLWRYVLFTLALMALAAAGGIGVAMYTFAEQLQALDARVTVFEIVRIAAVVTARLPSSRRGLRHS